jgi:hypothetical protein
MGDAMPKTERKTVNEEREPRADSYARRRSERSIRRELFLCIQDVSRSIH